MMVWRIRICVEELGVYLYVIDWWYPNQTQKKGWNEHWFLIYVIFFK